MTKICHARSVFSHRGQLNNGGGFFGLLKKQDSLDCETNSITHIKPCFLINTLLLFLPAILTAMHLTSLTLYLVFDSEDQLCQQDYIKEFSQLISGMSLTYWKTIAVFCLLFSKSLWEALKTHCVQGKEQPEGLSFLINAKGHFSLFQTALS